MKTRVVTVEKKTLKTSSDHGFMPGDMATRLGFVWELTRDVWSLVPGQNAEQRLQRHVAVLHRNEG